MQFSDHQKRLWQSMIRFTDDYLAGKIAFSAMVASLEGILDASDIKDQDVIKKWYDMWTPLEIIRADTDASVSDEEKMKAAKEMKIYLQSVIG